MRHPHDEDDDTDEYVIIERRSRGGAGAFVAGLAVGAALALLLAPRSGAETRAGLARGARRARGAVRDAGGLGEGARGVMAFAREAVAQRVETAKQAVELKATQVSRAYAAGRLAAQQAREDLERRIAAQRDAAGARGARAAAAPGDGASPPSPGPSPASPATPPVPPADDSPSSGESLG